MSQGNYLIGKWQIVISMAKSQLKNNSYICRAGTFGIANFCYLEYQNILKNNNDEVRALHRTFSI